MQHELLAYCSFLNLYGREILERMYVNRADNRTLMDGALFYARSFSLEVIFCSFKMKEAI